MIVSVIFAMFAGVLYSSRLVRPIERITTTAQALQNGERPDVPAGRAVAKCEAPRGELIYYLKTNGEEIPERVKWRVPSFMNWDALHFMFKGAKIADIAIIVNSIDPCVSCTER